MSVRNDTGVVPYIVVKTMPLNYRLTVKLIKKINILIMGYNKQEGI